MTHPSRQFDQGSTVQLRAGRPLRLKQAGGRRVAVAAGIVWITVEGLDDDIFVHAGEAYTIPGDGLTLVEAIGEARVSVDLPCHGRSPEAAAATENGGQADPAASGRIKSAVPLRLPIALRAPALALFRVPRLR